MKTLVATIISVYTVNFYYQQNLCKNYSEMDREYVYLINQFLKEGIHYTIMPKIFTTQ